MTNAYKEPQNHIVYNALQTPDGTILESLHRHDYKQYIDANGESYMIDGGLDYLRYNLIPKAPPILLTVYNDDPHTLVRTVIRWGSYGVTGKDALKVQVLADMSNLHIKNIIENITHIPKWRMDIFEDELEYRKVKNINIEG